MGSKKGEERTCRSNHTIYKLALLLFKSLKSRGQLGNLGWPIRKAQSGSGPIREGRGRKIATEGTDL